ncbi:MAG TPA: hypothetical protein VHT30_09590 [Acidimicrobiales bacterium]|jgi:ABC-2 type transport system permease protein|nr:hypothetical protein [Acidimicrobiales bacterium]
MNQALHAEWTKLWTVRGTGWLLAAMIGLTVGLSAAVTGAARASAGDRVQDLTSLSLSGVKLGQAVVAILAVLAVGSEYSSGMIHLTLVAMPRRGVMLAAKAAVVSVAVVAAGTVAVVGCLLMGRLLLSGHGFDRANGYVPLSLLQGATLRAAAGSVLYLALIGLMSLGIATLVRDSGAAIGLVLALVYLFPIFAQVISNQHWQRHLQQIGPMAAGLAIQSTINLHALPIGPWPGLGVMGLWALGSMVAGGLALQLRDA